MLYIEEIEYIVKVKLNLCFSKTDKKKVYQLRWRVPVENYSNEIDNVYMLVLSYERGIVL